VVTSRTQATPSRSFDISAFLHDRIQRQACAPSANLVNAILMPDRLMTFLAMGAATVPEQSVGRDPQMRQCLASRRRPGCTQRRCCVNRYRHRQQAETLGASPRPSAVPAAPLCRAPTARHLERQWRADCFKSSSCRTICDARLERCPSGDARRF
jgi:hypothetical protein